jgi:outer membrane immunogenic protein
MLRNYVLLSGVAFFAAATPAFSADLKPVRKAPPPAVAVWPLQSWSGFYAGPTLGWVRGFANGYYQGTSRTPTPGTLEAVVYALFGLDLDPVSIGALGGYNFQNGNAVSGIELDAGWIGRKGRAWAPDGSNRYDEIGVTWNGHLRGRVGYALGQFPPYIAGGLALAGFQTAHFRGATNTLWEASDTRAGYTVGGGVEFGGTIPGWTVRGEYLYDHFLPKRYDWVAGMRYTVEDLTIHTLRAAATYRFPAAP